ASDVPTLVEVLQAQGYFAAAINKLSHMRPATKFQWDLALHGSGRHPAAFGADVARCLDEARRARRPFFVDANITHPPRPLPAAATRRAVPDVPSPTTPTSPAPSARSWAATSIGGRRATGASRVPSSTPGRCGPAGRSCPAPWKTCRQSVGS